MKIKKNIFIFSCIIIIILIVVITYYIYITNTKKKQLKQENNVINIKDEIYLNNIYLNDYCFSEDEKEIISSQWNEINVFDNSIFEIEKCGEIRISYNTNKIRPYGYIFLYSKSSYNNLKKWFELNYNDDSIRIYDDWIWFVVKNSEIRFYKNDVDDTFRVVYVVSLPYEYDTKNIEEFPKIVQLFLVLNLKNVKK